MPVPGQMERRVSVGPTWSRCTGVRDSVLQQGMNNHGLKIAEHLRDGMVQLFNIAYYVIKSISISYVK